VRLGFSEAAAAAKYMPGFSATAYAKFDFAQPRFSILIINFSLSHPGEDNGYTNLVTQEYHSVL
jgi:hypothetical protein